MLWSSLIRFLTESNWRQFKRYGLAINNTKHSKNFWFYASPPRWGTASKTGCRLVSCGRHTRGIFCRAHDSQVYFLQPIERIEQDVKCKKAQSLEWAFGFIGSLDEVRRAKDCSSHPWSSPLRGPLNGLTMFHPLLSWDVVAWECPRATSGWVIFRRVP